MILYSNSHDSVYYKSFCLFHRGTNLTYYLILLILVTGARPGASPDHAAPGAVIRHGALTKRRTKMFTR